MTPKPQTADEVLEPLKRGAGLAQRNEAKAALLAGLLEKMPEPEDKITTEYDTSFRQGYNQGVADAVEAIKEYFGLNGISVPKEEYVKLAGEVKEIVDKEYLGSDV